MVPAMEPLHLVIGWATSFCHPDRWSSDAYYRSVGDMRNLDAGKKFEEQLLACGRTPSPAKATVTDSIMPSAMGKTAIHGLSLEQAGRRTADSLSDYRSMRCKVYETNS